MHTRVALASLFLLGCTGHGKDGPASTAPPPETAKPPTSVEAALPYPETRRDAVVDTLHGTRVPDPYRWLEDVSTPEVKAWMKAQDELARTELARLPGREGLEQRLIELTYIDSVSPPTHRGDKYFYARNHADKEKAVYYFRRGKDGKEEVLIDPNLLSEDGSISVRGLSPSERGRYVAYKLSENNADASTIYVKDLKTMKDSAIDVIRGAKYASPAWTPDDKGFYYVLLPTDPAIPPSELPGYAELRYHRLGTQPETDALVFPAQGDPTKFLGGAVTENGHFLLLYKSQGPNTEVHFMDLRSKKSRAKGFIPLATGFTAQYGVDEYRDQFYVTTNEGAPRRRVLKVDPAKPEREHWREIIGQADKAVLEGAYVVGGHLVADLMVDAHSQIEIHDLEGKLLRRVELPGLGATSGMIGRADEDNAYFYYTSFAQPPMIYETSIASGTTKLWDKIEFPVDTSKIAESQVWYTSEDGTKVSMFLVHAKDIELDGSHPTLLTGYGGFNVSMTPGFSPATAMWIERGGVWAMPNLRGGGEYGEAWHEAGMLGNKQNVFDDFIAAAEYLVAEGYTRPGKLGISGGSNGGLLVGAVMTQRPALFGAVVCAVPLLDMVRYPNFGSGKTWIPEYGDPAKADHFAFLHAYSPYHRVSEGVKYPAMLMLSADSDDRVDPMHARKFTAAIQAASGSGEPAIMRIEEKAGHGGAGTRKKAVAQQVDTYSFLLSELEGSQDAMRLFVGIDLPPEIEDHLALVGGGIPRARWEDRDKLHVTVRFIGEVDGGIKRRIEDALDEVRHPPFALTVAGVGFFPPGGQPRILWAGLDDPAPLLELHGRIERALDQAGLEPEGRKYTPHVTLARLGDAPRAKVIEFLQYHALLRTLAFDVHAFQLYSSVLSPRGSKYRIEHHYPLTG